MKRIPFVDKYSKICKLHCCKAITHWWNWTMWFGKVRVSVLVLILLDKSGIIHVLINTKIQLKRVKFWRKTKAFTQLPPNLKIIFGHCHQILYWLPSSTEKSEIFCLLDHWSMTGTQLLSHRLKLIIEQTLQIKLMGKWRNYIRIRHQVIS